jgi:putative hemolysin
VIGTYRVLTPAQAKRIGSTYSDTEFDLTRLRSLRERMVELGRSCVHPDHRHGRRHPGAVGRAGRASWCATSWTP